MPEVKNLKQINIRLTRFDFSKLAEMRDNDFIKNPTSFCTKAVEKELEKKYQEFLATKEKQPELVTAES
jgi:hypothetical protein